MSTLRRRLHRFLRDLAAPAPRPATDYAALGRSLAARDEDTLAGRRVRDAQRRRVALATGTVVADAPVRRETPAIDVPAIPRRALTPFEAMAAVPSIALRGVERTVSVVVAELADCVRDCARGGHARGALLLALAVALGSTLGAPALHAQDAKIKDLTTAEGAAPIRLVGYGLVVGLDGTGDKSGGARGAGMTVQSVVNLLRRFDVEVPVEMMRTRNVAAVLVSAEVSPYLRSGGRFDVHVSSLGDARSLRGGTLWMTPLVAEAGGRPMAAAQGALVISEAADPRDRYAAPTVETTARLLQGGQLEADLPRPTFAAASRLLLKEPDIGTASKIAAAINGALGAKTATVEDPGAVALALPDTGDRAMMLSRVRELSIRPDRVARLVIDGRDGTVVAGGDITLGAAVVSHGAITLTIAASSAGPTAPPAGTRGDTSQTPGAVRVAPGASVQQVAAALHAVQTPAPEIAAIFTSLREVGALAAEVIVR